MSRRNFFSYCSSTESFNLLVQSNTENSLPYKKKLNRNLLEKRHKSQIFIVNYPYDGCCWNVKYPQSNRFLSTQAHTIYLFNLSQVLLQIYMGIYKCVSVLTLRELLLVKFKNTIQFLLNLWWFKICHFK